MPKMQNFQNKLLKGLSEILVPLDPYIPEELCGAGLEPNKLRPHYAEIERGDSGVYVSNRPLYSLLW